MTDDGMESLHTERVVVLLTVEDYLELSRLCARLDQKQSALIRMWIREALEHYSARPIGHAEVRGIARSGQ